MEFPLSSLFYSSLLFITSVHGETNVTNCSDDCSSIAFDNLMNLYENNNVSQFEGAVHTFLKNDAPSREEWSGILESFFSSDRPQPDFIGKQRLPFLGNCSRNHAVTFPYNDSFHIPQKYFYGKLEHMDNLQSYVAIGLLGESSSYPESFAIFSRTFFKEETNDTLIWHSFQIMVSYTFRGKQVRIQNSKVSKILTGEMNLQNPGKKEARLAVYTAVNARNRKSRISTVYNYTTVSVEGKQALVFYGNLQLLNYPFGAKSTFEAEGRFPGAGEHRDFDLTVSSKHVRDGELRRETYEESMGFLSFDIFDQYLNSVWPQILIHFHY